ncbi:MAG: twin-arginine translocase subunit TatC, partial [Blastopirellula sp. JB062]
KSLVWLAIGLAVGLLIANQAIHAIERPVKDALVKYNQLRTLQRLKDQLKQQEGVEEITSEKEEELLKIAEANQWSPEILYIEPAEIKRISDLKDKPSPALTSDSADPIDLNELKKEVRDLAIVPQTAPVAMVTWKQTEASLVALKVEEVFMIWLKAGLVCGAIIASPMIFWHIWQFVAAGLYPHEKKYIWIYLPFSLGLFFGGAALAYFYVFAPVLEFLFSFNLALGIDPDPRISEWMSFALLLPLGFGISFQLPLVMLLLNRIGLVEVRSYTEHWRIAVLVICVLSAILTPADPLSMLLLAAPLTFLYFGGIGLCLWMPGRRAPMAPIR